MIKERGAQIDKTGVPFLPVKILINKYRINAKKKKRTN
jgi:hypothetical protein